MDGGLCRKKILTTIPIIRIRLIFYMKNRLYNCCKFRFYPKTYYSLIGTPEAIRGGEVGYQVVISFVELIFIFCGQILPKISIPNSTLLNTTVHKKTNTRTKTK